MISAVCQGLLPTIRHFENRRGEGPGDEVGISCDLRANDYEASGTSHPSRQQDCVVQPRFKRNMVKLYYYRNQRFSKLKAQCEKDERLFVDPEFPPETKSLYFSRATPPEPVEWKRPKVTQS